MVTAPLTKLGEIARSRDLGDIVESRGIKLIPSSGRVRQGVCPFHDESEGSFTVYADSQRFHCFGCETWGDALDFIRKLDNVSIQEAARILQRQPALPVSAHYSMPKARRTTRQDSTLIRAALTYYRGHTTEFSFGSARTQLSQGPRHQQSDRRRPAARILHRKRPERPLIRSGLRQGPRPTIRASARSR